MTTAKRKPPTQKERRTASVQSLLKAALELFVTQGYRHTTAEQISARAGLSKGALFFYFPSKETALLELLVRAERVVVDNMMERIAEAGPSATDKMVAFVHGQAALGVKAWEQVLLLILMSLEFQGQEGVVAERVRRIYARLWRAVEDVVEFGRQRGEFATDVPLQEQAAVVMAGHDGTFLQWHRRSGALDGPALVRALRLATLAGLTRGSSEKPRTTEKGEDQ
ncbi:MAG: TetR/AcrR family transcriptional regulator [Alphaproteobacteria bacterium]|nr:TetR/AcrR family transcriptional regulator [Alphaproteobacteria bacterium]